MVRLFERSLLSVAIVAIAVAAVVNGDVVVDGTVVVDIDVIVHLDVIVSARGFLRDVVVVDEVLSPRYHFQPSCPLLVRLL